MVNQTAEYALRAVVFLAQHHGKPQTNAAIAEATQVPGGYLPKIMLGLARRQLVLSRRGLGGGFVLAREPAEISVFDVLVAVDAAPERITSCPLGLPGHETLCPLHRLLDDAVVRVSEAFTGTTIASLLASTAGVHPLCEVVARTLAPAGTAGAPRRRFPEPARTSPAARAAATRGGRGAAAPRTRKGRVKPAPSR